MNNEQQGAQNGPAVRDDAPPKDASPLNGQVPPPNRRWKPGQSGNPGGRPKGPGVTAALRALAQTQHNGKSVAEVLAERLMKEALSGKFPFAKEVLERLEGK